MNVFTRVVETSSFGRTASVLNLPRASVRVIIQHLNRHVAVNHFQGRTSRIMGLTFEVDGRLVEVKMQGQIAVNDAAARLSLRRSIAPRVCQPFGRSLRKCSGLAGTGFSGDQRLVPWQWGSSLHLPDSVAGEPVCLAHATILSSTITSRIGRSGCRRLCYHMRPHA